MPKLRFRLIVPAPFIDIVFDQAGVTVLVTVILVEASGPKTIVVVPLTWDEFQATEFLKVTVFPVQVQIVVPLSVNAPV